MEKTFSDGIMNGLAALTPPVPEDMLLHSDDYRKGFICGFSHALEKRCNNVTIAHYRAGQLTFKYRLSQEQLSEFLSMQQKIARPLPLLTVTETPNPFPSPSNSKAFY